MEELVQSHSNLGKKGENMFGIAVGPGVSRKTDTNIFPFVAALREVGATGIGEPKTKREDGGAVGSWPPIRPADRRARRFNP